MHSHLSLRFTYFAAFALGSLLALLVATPARAAEPFRLDRVAVVRFLNLENGRLQRSTGVMDLEGNTTWRFHTEVDRPANIPEWSIGRNLISYEAWHAYRALAASALDNFETDSGVRFEIGEESFYLILPREDAFYAVGTLVNLSTRARLAGSGDVIIAGFVVSGRPRAVLVRAVGPTLIQHGVPGAAHDPQLSINRGSEVLYTNDNWNDQPDVAFIRKVATLVGAGPLVEGAKDAARLVLLDPGVYTVQVQTVGASAGGDVVVEIYDVSPDAILEGEFGT